MSSSMSSAKGGQIGSSLDLHGKFKEQAIADLTRFLEGVMQNRPDAHAGNPVWVTIVTGTGSHSAHGPVLRSAVDCLLKKRNMTYSLENKGCFLVNANSGRVLYSPLPPTDTKIQISRESTDQTRLVGRVTNMNNNILAAATPLIISSSALLPAQVAADDNIVKQAKQLSIDERNQTKRSQVESEKEFKKALFESGKEANKMEREEEAQEEELQRALSMSQTDTIQNEDEDELLKKIVSDSLFSEEQRILSNQRITKVMKHALSQSLLESCELKNTYSSEEEAQLKQALETSFREM